MTLNGYRKLTIIKCWMSRLAEKAQTDNERRSNAKEKQYPLQKLAASVNLPSRCQASEQTLN
jgi:hypothetical protein